jgi:hypothetical protein
MNHDDEERRTAREIQEEIGSEARQREELLREQIQAMTAEHKALQEREFDLQVRAQALELAVKFAASHKLTPQDPSVREIAASFEHYLRTGKTG